MNKVLEKKLHEVKGLERHTGNGYHVKQTFKRIDAKIEKERRLEGPQKYDLRQQLAKRQLTVNYGGIYN